jgi:hypothetical protein
MELMVVFSRCTARGRQNYCQKQACSTVDFFKRVQGISCAYLAICLVAKTCHGVYINAVVHYKHNDGSGAGKDLAGS